MCDLNEKFPPAIQPYLTQLVNEQKTQIVTESPNKLHPSFSTTWGLLMYEAGKGNMQMLVFICIELIPLNSFLGFPNIFMVFSAYTCQSFFLSVKISLSLFFFCFHVRYCLKVLQFLNPLKVRISLENSIILNRKETTITEKANSNDPSA